MLLQKHENNVERLQLMLVELRKSANPQTYYRFLLALNGAGYCNVVQKLEPNFTDGKAFPEDRERNNNQNITASGESVFSPQLGRLIQPAVFHHVPPLPAPILDLPANAVTPGLLHATSEPTPDSVTGKT